MAQKKLIRPVSGLSRDASDELVLFRSTRPRRCGPGTVIHLDAPKTITRPVPNGHAPIIEDSFVFKDFVTQS